MLMRVFRYSILTHPAAKTTRLKTRSSNQRSALYNAKFKRYGLYSRVINIAAKILKPLQQHWIQKRKKQHLSSVQLRRNNFVFR
ncbi:hypothetical protein FOBRF1_004687 [Fusarium oxysporum]